MESERVAEPSLPCKLRAGPEVGDGARFALLPGALDSTLLLGERGEVDILHEGATYHLRRTRQGKLILTK